MLSWSGETLPSKRAPPEGSSNFRLKLANETELASMANTPCSRLSSVARSEPFVPLERCSSRCSCASPACSVPEYVPCGMPANCANDLPAHGSSNIKSNEKFIKNRRKIPLEQPQE